MQNESTTYDGFFLIREGPNERVANYKKGSKIVHTTYSKVSADRKTMTVHLSGLNEAGRTVKAIVVYPSSSSRRLTEQLRSTSNLSERFRSSLKAAIAHAMPFLSPPPLLMY